MLICSLTADFQANLNCDSDFDWSSSGSAYANLEELPTFIVRQRQSATERIFTTTADPSCLQGKQLQTYQLVKQHMESNNSSPLRLIVSGTAGTGKSYLIHCLRLFLQRKVRVVAPTGVAAFNVDGHTLHSLLYLPTKGDFKNLEGEHLNRIQQSLAGMEYLIIDEMSMVGRKMFGQVDMRLRQVFPHRSDQVLGGCSCLLFGDFGQLPPVMDLPLYTTSSSSALSDVGSSSYQMFDHAVILDQIMRQSGQDPSQVLFREILLRLRNGEVTESDWKHLMTRTPVQLSNMSSFDNALHLFPTVEAVVEHNVSKLHASGQPVATIKAVHTGANASKASSDDAGGLEPVVCLGKSARVMLSSNLWVDMGLVNGAMGTVQAICYREGGAPPDLPVAVTILFDNYSGPTLTDGTVPIVPLRRSWSSSGSQCSRLQLPLKLAWAVTIHKSQGLTLDKVTVDIGKKEFCAGLTFVAISRVRRITDLQLSPPFPFQRLKNLAKSRRMDERKNEEKHLYSLETITFSTDHASTHVPGLHNCTVCTYSLLSQLTVFSHSTCICIVFTLSTGQATPPQPSEWMDQETSHSLQEYMDQATPSPPPSFVGYMDQATPSPPSEWMDQDTPSPPLSLVGYMDQATPSPPSEWMDQGTPSLPSLVGYMDQDTPCHPSQ